VPIPPFDFSPLGYARLGFLFGLTRLFDFGAVHSLRYTLDHAWQRDLAALRSDWNAVAGDMRRAVSKVRAEQGLEPAAS
jgi:hypothetical protein